jgi:hypothetical protein
MNFASSQACYMPRLSRSPWFHRRNKVWQRRNLKIMQPWKLAPVYNQAYHITWKFKSFCKYESDIFCWKHTDQKTCTEIKVMRSLRASLRSSAGLLTSCTFWKCKYAPSTHLPNLFLAIITSQPQLTAQSFRQSKHITCMKQTEGRAPLAGSFMPVSCLPYSSTLKMEAVCSSETSVDFQRTTRRYIPEYSTRHATCNETAPG